MTPDIRFVPIPPLKKERIQIGHYSLGRIHYTRCFQRVVNQLFEMVSFVTSRARSSILGILRLRSVLLFPP